MDVLYSRSRRCPARALLLVLTIGVIGCGGSGPFEYIPVAGTVTYDDGSKIPLSSMRLIFIPLDAPDVAGAHPRRAMANVNGEGAFDCATSYKYGDGLIPGKHKVVIEAAAAKDGVPMIPTSCLSETTTTLVVDTSEVPLMIEVPRP